MNEFELNLFKQCYPYLKIVQSRDTMISKDARVRLKKLIEKIEVIVYPERADWWTK